MASGPQPAQTGSHVASGHAPQPQGLCLATCSRARLPGWRGAGKARPQRLSRGPYVSRSCPRKGPPCPLREHLPQGGRGRTAVLSPPVPGLPRRRSRRPVRRHPRGKESGAHGGAARRPVDVSAHMRQSAGDREQSAFQAWARALTNSGCTLASTKHLSRRAAAQLACTPLKLLGKVLRRDSKSGRARYSRRRSSACAQIPSVPLSSYRAEGRLSSAPLPLGGPGLHLSHEPPREGDAPKVMSPVGCAHGPPALPPPQAAALQATSSLTGQPQGPTPSAPVLSPPAPDLGSLQSPVPLPSQLHLHYKAPPAAQPSHHSCVSAPHLSLAKAFQGQPPHQPSHEYSVNMGQMGGWWVGG